MIKELIAKYTEKIVVLLLTALPIALSKLVYNFLLKPLLEANQGKTIIQITALLLGLLLLSISFVTYLYIFKLRPKNKIKRNFIYNDKIGIYIHKKTDQRYCGTCMLENIESPLITLEYGWFCQRKGCSRNYSDPKNPRPAPKRESDPWLSRNKRW